MQLDNKQVDNSGNPALAEKVYDALLPQAEGCCRAALYDYQKRWRGLYCSLTAFINTCSRFKGELGVLTGRMTYDDTADGPAFYRIEYNNEERDRILTVERRVCFPVISDDLVLLKKLLATNHKNSKALDDYMKSVYRDKGRYYLAPDAAVLSRLTFNFHLPYQSTMEIKARPASALTGRKLIFKEASVETSAPGSDRSETLPSNDQLVLFRREAALMEGFIYDFKSGLKQIFPEIAR